MAEQPTVHVVGSVNADITLPVPALPVPGSTVLAGVPVRAGGGKGANVAVAAARDGARVRMIAAVGDDVEGRLSLRELAEEGVDTAGVTTVDGRATGLAVICVDPEGENFVVVSPGANGALVPADVERGLDRLGNRDVCAVNFEIPEAAVAAAAATVARRGGRLLVNPSPVRRFDDALLDASTTLVANAGEVAALTGEADVAQAAAALHARGCGTVVVTLGRAGARVTSADGAATAVPASPACVVDTTGAGDTFAGVLAAGLTLGLPIVEAVCRAAAAAALSTQRVGARAAIPTAGATDRLLSGDSD